MQYLKGYWTILKKAKTCSSDYLKIQGHCSWQRALKKGAVRSKEKYFSDFERDFANI